MLEIRTDLSMIEAGISFESSRFEVAADF